jgi:polyisoprenyl-teichoic acid--peptidoglycan teichoic acid transferase
VILLYILIRYAEKKMHFRPLNIVILFILLLGMGCNLPVSIATQDPISPTPAAIAYLLVTPDPNALPTPTPFQPISPTATFLPPPDPSATPTLPVPDALQPTSTDQTTAGPVAQSEGTVNILLLGSDARPNEYGFRTDVILWLALNPKLGTATLLSFPRDLWVYIPGLGNQRINVAMAYGFNVLQQTFQYNFGIKPDHYVVTSFSGFESIIDTLGGIDVNAAQYLKDACDLPQADGAGNCTVSPGVIHMNGATALWYARARHTTSDFDRTRRAQEVIIAGFRRLMSLDAVAKAGILYSQFKSAVQSDLSLADITPLLPMAAQLTDTSKIRRFAIGPNQVYDWITPEGAMVLVPVMSACQVVIQEAFGTP